MKFVATLLQGHNSQFVRAERCNELKGFGLMARDGGAEDRLVYA